MSLTEAFSLLGAKCKNYRWSWSGRSDDGKIVALTFWDDKFYFKSRPVIYDDTGWDAGAHWLNHPGNNERKENIKHALKYLNGEVGVIIIQAMDNGARERKIRTCFARKDMKMRITFFNEVTGEWRAESI